MANKKTTKTSRRGNTLKLYTPDGQLSKSKYDYFKPWLRMEEKLCRILNVKCAGFDPGFLVYDPDTDRSCNIPQWVAEKIIESHRGK